MFPSKNFHPLLKIVNNSIIDLPTPQNISYFWNFGSLLGICLILQISSGLFLSMSYVPNKFLAFKSVMLMELDNNFLFIIQMIHANGASLFFFCIFIHIGRGIYYQSYKLIWTWTLGVILLFLTMATAFMGYVLPWGQMSFWGATVITNLLATIPYLGNDLVIWLWGGFSVENPTLNRFFVIHFLLPFIILMITMIHLLFLHQSGSNNPLGLNSNMTKIYFFPYFIYKDFKGFMILFLILMLLIFLNPYFLGDSDNFLLANPLNTPIHIQPEWYFLFAYAILRSIPNKLGGVIALMFSVFIFFFLPIWNSKFQSNIFFLINKLTFWFMVFIIILLTWIGMSPMEFPFTLIGQILTIFYFSYFLINPILMNFWNKMIN